MTIGQPSGTYNWDMDNASITLDAFERCGKDQSALQRHDWVSARRSLNLVLARWSNRGVNLWKVMGPTQVPLVQGTATYTVSPNAVYMLDMYYTNLNGGGAGVNADRIMIPVSRTEYAEYPNKLQQGTPTVYWYDKLSPTPQFTIYQAPALDFAAGYCLNYYWLSRIEDANQTSGETPDVPYLGLAALVADLALDLARKPTLTPMVTPQRFQDIQNTAKETWDEFASTNREDVPINIRPNVSGYFRD